VSTTGVSRGVNLRLFTSLDNENPSLDPSAPGSDVSSSKLFKNAILDCLNFVKIHFKVLRTVELSTML
jgi:hypothetical protein